MQDMRLCVCDIEVQAGGEVNKKKGRKKCSHERNKRIHLDGGQKMASKSENLLRKRKFHLFWRIKGNEAVAKFLDKSLFVVLQLFASFPFFPLQSRIKGNAAVAKSENRKLIRFFISDFSTLTIFSPQSRIQGTAAGRKFEITFP